MTPRLRPTERLLPLLLFLLSGASSLTYEVVWQKRLFLTLGASAPATTVVLAAFCVGLGVGGYAGTALARRLPHPWLLYGLVELGIGLGALLFPWLLSAVDSVYPHLVASAGALDTTAVLVRFGLALLCLLPATVAMGATVPLMSLILARSRGGPAGEIVSLAYALNTFGAVAGCWLAGLHLVPSLGQTATLRIAYALNVICTLAALAMSRQGPASAAPPEPAHAEPAPPPLSPRSVRIFQAVYLAMGGLAFAFEVLAFRILAIYCSGGTVTFAVGLSVYLAGFALGSGPLYRIVQRQIGPAAQQRGLLLAASGTGLALLVQLPLVRACPALRDWARPLATSLGFSPVGALAASELVVAASLLLLPALFLGMSFPAACALLLAGRPELGRSGQVYLIGNIGSLAGILLAALWLVPAAGLVGTYGLLAAAFVALALVLLVHQGGRLATTVPVGVAALVVALAYGITGTPYFRSGEARRSGDYLELRFDPRAQPVQVLRYRSGSSATVMVKREPYAAMGARASQVGLYVDDQLVASTHPSARVDSKLLAHLPLLLHPAPRRALTVGFGSGGTSWSMLTHDVQVDAVEIEPEVPASAGHFEDLNQGVLGRPGFRLVINDARDHLRLAKERYDVISTDATNVQYKQNASLYSREYFELMKARLTPDGIACAWLPFAGLPTRSVPHAANPADDELKILLRTFQAVFPHSYLFIFDHWNTDFAIVIGTPGPLRIDLIEVARRFARPAVARDLGEVDIVDPRQLIHFLYLDAEGLRAYDGPGWLHTDDLPVLERAASVSAQVGYRTLPERMRDLLGRRPASLRPYLAREPDASEGESLERWRAFSRAWGDAIWAAMFAGLRAGAGGVGAAGEAADPGPELERARGALEKAWSAFGTKPPLPRGRFEQLRQALIQLGRPAPAR